MSAMTVGGGVETARVALAGVREEERLGQRTRLDMLNAEQELLNGRHAPTIA